MLHVGSQPPFLQCLEPGSHFCWAVTGFQTVLTVSIKQVDEAGREMKDPKMWIQLRKSERSILTDFVIQNLFWILLS